MIYILGALGVGAIEVYGVKEHITSPQHRVPVATAPTQSTMVAVWEFESIRKQEGRVERIKPC